MRESIAPDVIAGLLVALAFLAGIAIAYRRGFQAAIPFRAAEFNFRATRLALDGTHWTIPTEWDSTTLPTTLAWQQVGSRVMGHGEQDNGGVWRIEGIVDGSRLVGFTQESQRPSSPPSIWVLRANARQTKLTGYRIAWNGTGSTLSIRELSLSRQASANVEPSLRECAFAH